MTKLLLEKYRATHDICVTFANTGQEHETTLQFINQCDKQLGFPTVWLEAVVDPEKGNGIRHKIVSFETASRNGEPFEAYIAKYGIPNMGSPQCTTRLKENVMDSYRRSIGWKFKSFDTAIGIRSDEAHRKSARSDEYRFIYPLLEWGWTKEMVIQEVRTWPFDLLLPGEHYGNCIWCWKKSLRKHLTLAKNSPEVFDFPECMENKYGAFKVSNATKSPDGRRLFFRGHRSVADIKRLALEPFNEFHDKHIKQEDDPLDYGAGCGEGSCEIGSDERYSSDGNISYPEDITTTQAISMDPLTKPIYLEYPRLEGWGKAAQTIEKALKTIQKEDNLCYSDTHEWLLRKTIQYRQHREHMIATGQSEAQYTPLPATWYGQQRYRDSESWQMPPKKPEDQDLYTQWKERWPTIEAEYGIVWEDKRFWGNTPMETWENLPAAVRAELKH